ncbi:hypothetical protein AQJ64_09830 [Streptomyces griseoruber]|uniref:Uncharacterized protein n=1 Tax=Streptomyces griseoruber TaxID=1943 RepID=A0A101T5N1_9ACTN|nr:hypothetical protein AQJ64_09830 [Streptomyces griseoruber]
MIVRTSTMKPRENGMPISGTCTPDSRSACSTSAVSTPTMSTRCWYCEGTANFPMIRTKTKRLSTLSDFSVMYPAKNWPVGPPPPNRNSPRPNRQARTTQTIVQVPASFTETSWGVRPTRKSTPTRAQRAARVSSQTARETFTVVLLVPVGSRHRCLPQGAGAVECVTRRMAGRFRRTAVLLTAADG